MFDDVSVVINGIRRHITTVQKNAQFGGQFFYALALATSYNYLIELTDERTQQHPEVERVPSLRLILLDHLHAYALQHINLQRGTIFDDGLLGGPRTLREWQDAGYHTARSGANYEKRLRYWKAIYDGAPITFQQRVASPDNIFSAGRAYQASFLSPKSGNVPKTPTNKQSGLAVTYEDVIHSRDTRYHETIQLVPWWRALNYGTGGLGYPSTGALHFIEDGERSVPGNIAYYSALFDQFINDMFDTDELSTDTQLTVESWVRSHVRFGKEYIPSLDIARQLTFEVPF